MLHGEKKATSDGFPPFSCCIFRRNLDSIDTHRSKTSNKRQRIQICCRVVGRMIEGKHKPTAHISTADETSRLLWNIAARVQPLSQKKKIEKSTMPKHTYTHAHRATCELGTVSEEEFEEFLIDGNFTFFGIRVGNSTMRLIHLSVAVIPTPAGMDRSLFSVTGFFRVASNPESSSTTKTARYHKKLCVIIKQIYFVSTVTQWFLSRLALWLVTKQSPRPIARPERARNRCSRATGGTRCCFRPRGAA